METELMAYPANYRSRGLSRHSRPDGGGSQGPRGGTRWPFTPTPANDNRPPAKVIPFPKVARTLGRAARLHPAVRGALLAWDAYQLYQLFQAARTLNTDKWQLYCGSGAGRYARFNLGCTWAAWQSPTASALDPPGWTTSNSFGVIEVGPIETSGVWAGYVRVTQIGEYRRRSSAWPTDPDFRSVWVPGAKPLAPPWFDPGQTPIFQPSPFPVPPPVEVVPHRPQDPHNPESYEAGNRSEPKPVPVDQSFTFTPGGTQEKTRPHRREPPGPGTKERKVRARAALGAMFKFVRPVQRATHEVTEWLDAVDAIHDALPPQYRAKGRNGREPTPQAKAEAIYRHFDKVNISQALLNLAANQLLDAVVGRAAGAADDFGNRHGITWGRAL